MKNDPRPIASSDSSLLVRFQAGEEDAATALYARYAQRLLGVAQRASGDDLAPRIAPEDIVQSVFRTFFRRVNDGHYLVPEGDELWKLLLVIALNKVRMVAEYHRAGKRDVSQTQRFPNSEVPAAETSIEILRMTIDDLLSTLPESHQQTIRARIDGHEIAEISKRVSVSQRSVERILQTFRKRLQKVLNLP
ncbi:sigma-70 family RNA polymerase sigma factor [Stieleria sp. JC731]|uniref:RNA polymerase sigma factor n=1 Tax=Pirellulaceae TaxID=2691357 RepID=UPI001E4C40AE|nr:sigma-70 family RNA polymerase sigma factor [Stieleria sp. JC731]MCC9603397.1 sigma-70 family RNA polymerase sigma factor [Stieleria sp. JC731]